MTKLKDREGDASIEGGYLLLGRVVLWRDDGYFPAASTQSTCQFEGMRADSSRAGRKLHGEDRQS